MGVHGLSKFIKNRKDKFLEDYQLHGTKLIIDGSNLIYFLYSQSGVSKLFGGDYDNFASKCKEFFNILATCAITPIVVFDGATDPSDRKLGTSLQRMTKQLDVADKGKGFILPLLAYTTLFHVLAELNVVHVTCLYEADREIAVLANKWQCPVLSNDGDFYVYSMEGGFIPLESMIRSVPKRYASQAGNGFCLAVKRYRCKQFLKEEFKMEDDEYIFPVFAVLNGNDYFDASKVTLVSPKDQDDLLNCASHDPEDVLKWICRAEFESGEKAFEQICEQIPDEMKQTFKESVDSYKDLTEFALSNFEAFLLINPSISARDRDGNVNGTSSPTVKAADQQWRYAHKEFEEPALTENTFLKDYYGNRLPSWIVDALVKCQMNGSFLLDIAVNHRLIFRCQMELLTQPSSYACTREMRRLIYRIVLGSPNKDEHEGFSEKSYVEEYDREMEPFNVEPVDTIESVSEIPSLWNILTLSDRDRLMILFAAFGANPESFGRNMDLTSKIFVLVSQLWMRTSTPNVNECHLDALLIGVMALHAFELDQMQTSTNSRAEQVLFKDIKNAMYGTKQVKFLKIHLRRHFGAAQNSDSRLVDREIVHIFAQFQACFLHTYYLQQVLQVPACTPSPSVLLNCTFVYNFYRDPKYKKDPNKYIDFLLGKGSAIHTLFTNWKASVLGTVSESAKELESPDQRSQIFNA